MQCAGATELMETNKKAIGAESDTTISCCQHALHALHIFIETELCYWAREARQTRSHGERAA